MNMVVSKNYKIKEQNVLYCSVKRSGMPAVRWRDEDP